MVSAPDIADKNIIDLIAGAVDRINCEDGLRKSDLAGKAKTKDFPRAVIKRLK